MVRVAVPDMVWAPDGFLADFWRAHIGSRRLLHA
jgi:hypothetical protein